MTLSSGLQTPGPLAITGAAGFIGSYLARRLLKEGHRPLLLVDEENDFAVRPCARPLLELERMNPEAFLVAMEKGEIRPSAVYHLGASSRTDEIREDYLNRVNLGYSQRLWNACVRSQVPLVYASSGSTYGAGEQGFSDEPELQARLKPMNPYGWSKHRFDLFVLEEERAGRTPPRWAGLKFFNVYGPGESHKGSQASMVHHTRKQLLEGGRVRLFKSENPLYKDGEQVRDFVYVGDCAEVATAAVQGTLKPGIYNVGVGRARTWVDLVQAVAAATGVQAQIDFIALPESLRHHYQYFTQADTTRLRAAGFTRPMTTLEDGVRKTFEEEKELKA